MLNCFALGLGGQAPPQFISPGRKHAEHAPHGAAPRGTFFRTFPKCSIAQRNGDLVPLVVEHRKAVLQQQVSIAAAPVRVERLAAARHGDTAAAAAAGPEPDVKAARMWLDKHCCGGRQCTHRSGGEECFKVRDVEHTRSVFSLQCPYELSALQRRRRRRHWARA
eukprot:TRINITY_DN1111_c2_g1_i5.p1 TRINITY_DN1111_c2_g1~~TRINITY_DN1111_c2_g1_i5.p1  ORF type:complete len:165 (-),score=7.67 TRINITY_DN1111_c2_g1_i5:254-748(-)